MVVNRVVWVVVCALKWCGWYGIGREMSGDGGGGSSCSDKVHMVHNAG